MSDTSKFYKFNKVLGANTTFMMVCGGRGIGKTFGAKALAIKAGIYKGEQFVLLRRYKTELKTAKATFFNDIIAKNLFPKWDFRPQGDEAQASLKTARTDKDRKWKTIGYFYSLTMSATIKSGSYPKVTRMIFDEFIIEKGNTTYLSDEYTKFLGFYSTFDRGEDRIRVFMLSNSVSMMNPYFLANDIKPDEIGEFKVIADEFICVHFPDSEAYKNEFKKTKFGKYIHKYVPEYADYASNNKFKDNHDLNIGLRPPEAIYRFTLETKDNTFSLWKRSDEWYCEQKLPADLQQRHYTLVIENAHLKMPFLERKARLLVDLRSAYAQGRVTFDNQQTRNGFINVGK